MFYNQLMALLNSKNQKKKKINFHFQFHLSFDFFITFQLMNTIQMNESNDKLY